MKKNIRKDDMMGRKYTKRMITEVKTGNLMLDAFLQMPMDAAKRVEREKERYEVALTRATLKGYDYEAVGKLGCRIMGTGCEDHDPMVNLIEASGKVEQEQCQFDAVMRVFDRTLKEAGLTSEQRAVCCARYGAWYVQDMETVEDITGIKERRCKMLHQRSLRQIAVHLAAEAEKQKVLKGA